MDSKERILTALNNQRPDRVPIFELYINESSIVNLVKLLSPEAVEVEAERDRQGEERLEILDLYCFLVDELGLDMTCSTFSTGMEYISKDRARDKHGTIYHLSEHGAAFPIEGPIKEPSDTRGFDMVSKLKMEDFAKVQYVIEKVGKDKAHFVNVWDPFLLSWRLRGSLENLLTDYILNPQLVHDLARITTDFTTAVIDMAVQVGVDVIFVSGDVAGQTNTLMSPKHYREFVKPYHRELVDYAHRKGVKIVKHSDGNIWLILDDLVEVGFDGIHPFQPQCMDIAQVKQHLAGRACVVGNIDCSHLLPFGTEEEVVESVKETIEKAAPGGGYILSSSNSIHPGCKPENYIAMVRATHEYGVYVG